MTVPIIAFFNSKGGLGTTSLVYHLAWMYGDRGRRVVVADLDPQASLTAAFLEDERLEQVWPSGPHPLTIFGAVEPMLWGTGDAAEKPHVERVSGNLGLIPGDLALAQLEGELAEQWGRCLDGQEHALRVSAAFWRVIQNAAADHGAEFALVDLGPNLGAINRAALVGCDYFAVPVVPDPFSIPGLRTTGPAVREWRRQWALRFRLNSNPALELPAGRMEPAGFVAMRERRNRPGRGFRLLYWGERIDEVYQREVLGEANAGGEHFLALIRNFPSLAQMAEEARKPMFHLTAADGAIGAHTKAVAEARMNFAELATKLLVRCGIREKPAAGV